MKRSSKLIIAVAAAALTFASLVAVNGPKDWKAYHRYHHGWHHHHHDDCEQDQQDQDNATGDDAQTS